MSPIKLSKNVKFDVTKALKYKNGILNFLNNAEAPRDIYKHMGRAPYYRKRKSKIGPKTADKIIRLRKLHFKDGFTDLEDLRTVPYLGESKFINLLYSAKKGILPRFWFNMKIIPIPRGKKIPTGRTVVNVDDPKERGIIESKDGIKNYPDLPEDAPPGIVTNIKDTEIKKKYLIYVVSDLHMGSHTKYDIEVEENYRTRRRQRHTSSISRWIVDKSHSNLFDKRQSERFVKFLNRIKKEHDKILEKKSNVECHLVINGDFLDLWQAKNPISYNSDGIFDVGPYSYTERINDIIDSNLYKHFLFVDYYDCDEIRKTHKREFWRYKHIKNIGIKKDKQAVGKNPNWDVLQALYNFALGRKKKVIYIVGNHDDPLYTRVKSDDASRKSEDTSTLRKYFISGITEAVKGKNVPKKTKDKFEKNFLIGRFYWNQEYGTYAEHGHVFDNANWRESEKCKGQKFVEDTLNPITERDRGEFSGLGNVPYYEVIAFFRCLAGRLSSKPFLDSYNAKKFKKVLSEIISEGAKAKGIWGRVWVVRGIIKRMFSEKKFFEISLAKMNTKLDEESSEYMNKGDSLAGAFGATVLTLGHTHLPFFEKKGNWVYANTGEWIFNVKQKGGPCRLERVYGNSDYFLKVSESTRGPGEISVELRMYPNGFIGSCKIPLRK